MSIGALGTQSTIITAQAKLLYRSLDSAAIGALSTAERAKLASNVAWAASLLKACADRIRGGEQAQSGVRHE